MKVIGIMSGTSLDGLDIALCDIHRAGFDLINCKTVGYPEQWRSRLASLKETTALEYAVTDVQLGKYIGQCINQFLTENNEHAELIASHGHTIFHQPEIGLTTQIGNADAIAAETKLPVVSNFRTLDVALGGQGAPLVPIGDELFFGQYDACLNLGGIANISFRVPKGRVAFDICPCNMVLNYLSEKIMLPYDNQGLIARSGKMLINLKAKMDSLEYYHLPFPKSLGREWIENYFLPLIENNQCAVADLLHTTTKHIAQLIAQTTAKDGIKSILITGGGAWNSFLIESIKEYHPTLEITIPNSNIINYKEAIIFALLGYLRIHHMPNTLASVTGAPFDSIGGNISGLVK